MKKNKFFTFILSCIPGAGQMYQGLMNRGASIMIVFFGVIALASLLYMPALTFLLPVLWFYSFFDAMNRSNLTEEQLSAIPDTYIFLGQGDRTLRFVRERHTLVGIGAVIVGGLMLYNVFSANLSHYLYQYFNLDLYYLMDALPPILLGCCIIAVGIRIMRGPSSVSHQKSSVAADARDIHLDTKKEDHS